jgi:hypothetical protein
MRLISLAPLAALVLTACTHTGAAPSLATASDTPAPASAEVDATPTSASATALGALGNAAPAAVDAKAKWDSIDETTRYLMIMGTIDGFTATGSGAPCFPGNDNTKLDSRLKAAGFGSEDHGGLPAALAKLSAPKAECVATTKRGYTTDLLKSMTDAHIAAYLSAVVRGYAHLKPCPATNYSYAASTIAADLFALPAPKDPAALIGPAMVTSCAYKSE